MSTKTIVELVDAALATTRRHAIVYRDYMSGAGRESEYDQVSAAEVQAQSALAAVLPRYEAALRLAEARVAREDAWESWGRAYGDGSPDEPTLIQERDRASEIAADALAAYREARS